MSFFKRIPLVVLAVALAGCSVDASSEDLDTSDEATGASADELSRARFTRKASPTDADLKAFHTAGKRFEHGYLGVYRFNRAGPEATSPEAREKRIKEVMHRYMCTFFDESIDIGRAHGPNRVASTLSALDFDYYVYEEDAAIAALTTALTRVYTDPKLDVLSGGASGNNTAGSVLGIYDTAHHEIVFFGFTNCGSDS